MRNEVVHLAELQNKLRQLIENELEDGESITWAGQPNEFQFAKRSLSVFLFGIFWTLFSVFWMFGAAGFKTPSFSGEIDFFPLFGIPFVLIGIGLLSSPLLMIFKARRTAYVITNNRVIIFDGGFSTTVRSFSPEQLQDIQRVQKGNGTGNLIFQPVIPQNMTIQQQASNAGFLAIDHVKEVEEHVRQLLGGNKKSPGDGQA